MLKEAELNEATLILVTECCEWYPMPDDAKNAIVSWVDKIDTEGLTQYGEHGYLVRKTVPLNPFDPEGYTFCKQNRGWELSPAEVKLYWGNPSQIEPTDEVDDGIN